MIDKLRLHGLVRLTAEVIDTGEWEVRLSKCKSGQGDVVSRRRSPDEALQGASDLFMQFAKPTASKDASTPETPKPARRKVTRGWPAPLPEDDDGSRLI